MDYQQFLKELKMKIMEVLPEHLNMVEIEYQMVKRNNNNQYEVMVIRGVNELKGTHIYMADYYQDYVVGKSLKGIAVEIVEIHLLGIEIWGYIPFDIKDYDQIKEHLVVQLINKETNSGLLKAVPHFELEHTNLTAIYRIYIDVDHSFIVKNDVFMYWNVSAETLHKKSLANTIHQNPFQVMNLLDAIGYEIQEYRGLDMKLESHQLYVLTNQSIRLGASAMLYPEVLKKIADNSVSSYFILPSSIHELILVCDSGDLDVEELQISIMEANRDVVSPEDVLSNDVYFYDKYAQTLTMVKRQDF